MIPKRMVGGSVILDIPDNKAFDNIEMEMSTLLANHRKRLILNLTDIDFTESTDLAILMVAYKLVNDRGGELAFYGMQTYGRRLLELTRLNHVLDIFDTEEQALNGFNAKAGLKAGLADAKADAFHSS